MWRSNRTVTRRACTALAACASSVLFAIAPAQAAPVLSAEIPGSPVDHLGRPAPHILRQIRDIANAPWLPVETRNSLLSVVAFYEGTGKSDIELPANAPRIDQFIWPTVSSKCIGGELDATGTAMAVAGPAEIPAPGAKTGETVFAFTALGTGPVAREQHTSMQVQWLNLNSLKFGVTPLTDHGINPVGPATVSGTAPTGTGTVVAWLTGGVSVEGTNGTSASTCNFAPTAATFQVR